MSTERCLAGPTCDRTSLRTPPASSSSRLLEPGLAARDFAQSPRVQHRPPRTGTSTSWRTRRTGAGRDRSRPRPRASTQPSLARRHQVVTRATPAAPATTHRCYDSQDCMTHRGHQSCEHLRQRRRRPPATARTRPTAHGGLQPGDSSGAEAPTEPVARPTPGLPAQRQPDRPTGTRQPRQARRTAPSATALRWPTPPPSSTRRTRTSPARTRSSSISFDDFGFGTDMGSDHHHRARRRAAAVAAVSAGTPAPAKPKCGGRTATIVGTGGRNRLSGTARADVIVGRGRQRRHRRRPRHRT